MLTLTNFQKVFNQALNTFLQQNKHPDVNNRITPFIEYTNQFFANSGKRIRPYLAYLMTGQTNIQQNLPLFIALELFHSFALIHDDIIDKSLLRRGQKTIHSFIEQLHKKQSPQLTNAKIKHIAYSQALLVGDYYFALAEKSFSKLAINVTAKSYQKLYQIFHNLKNEVIWGQHLDVDLTSQENTTLKQIETKNYYKTASYSIIRPMQLGWYLNQSANNQNIHQFCHDFGVSAGIAFQIQDDYLNLFFDQATTGKEQYLDIAEAQHTVFSQKIFAYPTTKTALLKHWGKPLAQINTKELQILLESEQLQEFGDQLITTKYNQAKQLLANIQIDEKIKNKLEAILVLLINRSH